MKEYHFDLGNSNEGTIGMCAVVKANDKEEAIATLKATLPSEMNVRIDRDSPETKNVEYVTIYFNLDNIKRQDITADI